MSGGVRVGKAATDIVHLYPAEERHPIEPGRGLATSINGLIYSAMGLSFIQIRHFDSNIPCQLL